MLSPGGHQDPQHITSAKANPSDLVRVSLTLVTEPAVEALADAILPQLAWIDQRDVEPLCDAPSAREPRSHEIPGAKFHGAGHCSRSTFGLPWGVGLW